MEKNAQTIKGKRCMCTNIFCDDLVLQVFKEKNMQKIICGTVSHKLPMYKEKKCSHNYLFGIILQNKRKKGEQKK